jgi:hypothetical protein
VEGPAPWRDQTPQCGYLHDSIQPVLDRHCIFRRISGHPPTCAARPGCGGRFVIPGSIVLIGLYILIGRFFVDALMRARTEYAVTNRRAIIVSGFFSRNVKSIDLKTTSEISISERGDKSGTITFGATPFGGMRRYSWSFNPTSGTPAFEMIDDVRSVYRTIEQVRNAKSDS